MYHIFVCYADPNYFLKNQNHIFSPNEIFDISELTDERMMNDPYFMDVLEKYGKPRWFVTCCSDERTIKLIIYANLSETDSKIIAEEFNNKLAEVARKHMEKGVYELL